jgi:hypothetical protein
MDIESRNWWEEQHQKLEKLKTDFGVNVNKDFKKEYIELQARVLEFYAQLSKQFQPSLEDDKFEEAYKKVIQPVLKSYKDYFGIQTHYQGKIEPIDIKRGCFTVEALGLTNTHCKECGCHKSKCKCNNYDTSKNNS